MNKAGRSNVLGVVAIGALLVCCGGPLLIVALVTLAASAGLIVQGAVLVGLVGLGLAAALGLRYVMRRSARGRSEQRCAECGDRAAGHHQRHPVPPAA